MHQGFEFVKSVSPFAQNIQHQVDLARVRSFSSVMRLQRESCQKRFCLAIKTKCANRGLAHRKMCGAFRD